jgi:hypothetical protein
MYKQSNEACIALYQKALFHDCFRLICLKHRSSVHPWVVVFVLWIATQLQTSGTHEHRETGAEPDTLPRGRRKLRLLLKNIFRQMLNQEGSTERRYACLQGLGLGESDTVSR